MAPILDIKHLVQELRLVRDPEGHQRRDRPGDFLVLVGPSGCGKSTLLNCIAGLEPITSGTIEIDGEDMTDVSPKDRDIAMVFQSYALYPTMSVAKNITFGMRVRGVDRERGRKLAERWPAFCRSSRCSNRKPASSPADSASAWPWAGRWCATQALPLRRAACRTSTPSCASRCAPRSSSCTRALGATMVYVTHDQIEAMTLATKIAVMKGGRDPADRHPRGDLRSAREHVRGRFHGLALDEPDPGALPPVPFMLVEHGMHVC
jgi:multiple sugar transport system ATP-binding protein